MIYKCMYLTALIAGVGLITASFSVMIFMAISLFGWWSIIWLFVSAVTVIVVEALESNG